jgi:hypothetical protein
MAKDRMHENPESFRIGFLWALGFLVAIVWHWFAFCYICWRTLRRHKSHLQLASWPPNNGSRSRESPPNDSACTPGDAHLSRESRVRAWVALQTQHLMTVENDNSCCYFCSAGDALALRLSLIYRLQPRSYVQVGKVELVGGRALSECLHFRLLHSRNIYAVRSCKSMLANLL